MESLLNFTLQRSNFTHATNTTHVNEEDVFLDRPQFLGWLAVTALEEIVGTAANILLLIAILTKKRLRGQSGVLIIHLTILEASMLSIHSSINTSAVYHFQYKLPNTVDCNWAQDMYATFMFAGNWSMCILSLNRFVALILPTYYKYITTPAALASMILVAWTLGFGFMTPIAVGIGGSFGPAISRGCDLVTVQPGDFFTAVNVMFFYVPLLLMVFVYLVLFAILQRQKRRLTADDGTRAGQRSLDARVRITRMLFGCAVWYFLCNVPAPILAMLFFGAKSRKDSCLFLWTRVIGLAGYVGTPLLSFALNLDYRNSAKEWIWKVFLHKKIKEGDDTTDTKGKKSDVPLPIESKDTASAPDID